MIAGIKELKTLGKHISCECKCRFDGRKCNSDQWWNNDKCQCECKKMSCMWRKIMFKNPSACNCEHGKDLANIMYNSAIMCDEVIESYDKETNFNYKKQPIKRKSSIFYLHLYQLL